MQEGENELTGEDAFWLGLIDEVYGESNMPCLRMIYEYQADPVPQTVPSSPTAGQILGGVNEESKSIEEETAKQSQAQPTPNNSRAEARDARD